MHPSTISSGSGSPFSFHQTGAANDDDRHRLEHQHEQHDLHAHGNLHADHFQEESHMDDQDAMKQLQQRGHANTDVQALHFERPQALAIEQNTLIGHGSAPLFDNMSGGGFLSPMTTELVSATAAFSSTSPLISTRQQWAAESRGAPVPTLTENTSPSTSAAETEGASISSGERGDGANAATASTDYYAAKNQMERAKVLRAIAAPAIAGHHSTTLSTDFSTLTLQLLSNQLYSASVNHGEAAGNQNADQLEQQSGSSSSSSSNSTHGAVLQPAVNEKGSRLQSTAPSASSQAAGGAFTQTDAMETSGDAGKRSRCNMHLRTKKIRGGSEQLAIDELALRAFHALEDDATRREHSRHERKRSKTSSYTSAGSGSDQGHDRMPALFEMGSAAGFFQHESANIDHDIDRDADDDESPSDDEFEDDDADEISAGAMAAEALEASVDGDFDGDSDAGSPDPEFESAMNAFKIRSVQLSKEEAGRAASKRKRSQGNSRKKRYAQYSCMRSAVLVRARYK